MWRKKSLKLISLFWIAKIALLVQRRSEDRSGVRQERGEHEHGLTSHISFLRITAEGSMREYFWCHRTNLQSKYWNESGFFLASESELTTARDRQGQRDRGES
jgi:hypothetical protein